MQEEKLWYNVLELAGMYCRVCCKTGWLHIPSNLIWTPANEARAVMADLGTSQQHLSQLIKPQACLSFGCDESLCLVTG